MTNPLLQDWTTPFQIAPFAEIEDDHFAPALEEALTAHMAEIDAIADNSDAPTFENTIEAMEGVALDEGGIDVLAAEDRLERLPHGGRARTRRAGDRDDGMLCRHASRRAFFVSRALRTAAGRGG